MAWRLPAVIVVICAATSLGTTAQADVANPPWPQRCPLKLGLLVDQSSSMNFVFNEVREAAKNVVDALRDKRSEVTVIGFAGDAKVIGAAVNVSDQAARQQLKENIDKLDTVGGLFGGGTNWESALVLAESLALDVAVMVTDGEPNQSNSYGSGSQGPLLDAVLVADRMKSAGARLVVIGIGLAGSGSLANLRRISGPVEGSDYYPSDNASLLRQLYEVVASACGVPVGALPNPEPAPAAAPPVPPAAAPPTFPLAKAILGTLGGLLLLVLVGYLRYRTQGGRVRPAPIGPQPASSKIADPTISHQDVRFRLERPAEPPAQPSTEKPRPTPPASRSRSLDFLAKPDSDRQKDV